MALSRRLFPFHQLPPGYARSLDSPASPPTPPHPAATLVLLRSSPLGIEALLLKRSPQNRFIPGAWVFPGGRVDPADGDPALLERSAGLDPARLADQMAFGSSGPGAARGSHPPPAAFLVAALREAYEETGLLLAASRGKSNRPASPGSGESEKVRPFLLDGRMSFREVLDHLDVRLDAGALEYVAHWTTPEAEPLRFDTRFFAGEVPPGSRVTLVGEEMVEARWLTPEQALALNHAGELPLVFPTLRTLETLVGFRTPTDYLDHQRGRVIPRFLPTLVRRKEGVEITLEHTEEG